MKRIVRYLGRTGRFASKLLHGEPLSYSVQSKEAWDAQFDRGAWDFMLDLKQRETLVIIASLCKEAADERPLALLDVGCGNGGLAKLLASDPSISYTGLDIAETAVRTARTLHPRGIFFVASAEEPPQFAEQFDILVFNEILYYVDLRKTLDAYRPYLKEGGVIVITMYASWRTWLLWLRLKGHVTSKKTVTVRDELLRKSWTIQWGNYRS